MHIHCHCQNRYTFFQVGFTSPWRTSFAYFCPPKSLWSTVGHQFIPTSYKGFQKVLLPSFGYLHVLNQTSGKIPSGAHPNTGSTSAIIEFPHHLPEKSWCETSLPRFEQEHSENMTWFEYIIIFSKKWVSICNINNYTYIHKISFEIQHLGAKSTDFAIHDRWPSWCFNEFNVFFFSMHPSEQ